MAQIGYLINTEIVLHRYFGNDFISERSTLGKVIVSANTNLDLTFYQEEDILYNGKVFNLNLEMTNNYSLKSEVPVNKEILGLYFIFRNEIESL